MTLVIVPKTGLPNTKKCQILDEAQGLLFSTIYNKVMVKTILRRKKVNQHL